MYFTAGVSVALKEFFKAVKRKFAYDGQSVKDLLYKLLQNHFYYYLDKSKSPLNSDARLFVKSWMDSSRYKESFERISKEVEHELNISKILEETYASKIMNIDTYAKCDQVIIRNLLSGLSDGGIASNEMLKIITAREHTFWFKSYQNIYQALLNASLLIDFVKQTNFKMQSFDEGIELYSSHWHKADRYYRDYSYYSSRAEHLELLKTLNGKIEDVYLNGFLRELNDTWQNFADGYTTETKTSHQQNFYRNFVEPLLRKNQKVFVIISDAMRYECGVELTSKISSIDRYTSTCESMVSSLPSYTKLGMASLLPHKRISMRDKNDTSATETPALAHPHI